MDNDTHFWTQGNEAYISALGYIYIYIYIYICDYTVFCFGAIVLWSVVSLYTIPPKKKQHIFSSIEVEKVKELKGNKHSSQKSVMKKCFSRLSMPHALIIAQLRKENACFL